MKLIDTHCHLDLEQYDSDLDAVIDRARENDVVKIIVPGININSSIKASKLTEKYPSLYAAAGIHPHEADNFDLNMIEVIKDLCENNKKIVAVGEVGLDYYRKFSSSENQQKMLREFIKAAREMKKPLILHQRDSSEDLIKILKEASLSSGYMEGVVHCFSGNKKFLEEVLDMGLYVSFAGNITFPRAEKSRELAKDVPLERLLLETDAPYISPEPVRGKRNEPANMVYLLDVYADLYKKSKEEIATVTTENAERLFFSHSRESGNL